MRQLPREEAEAQGKRKHKDSPKTYHHSVAARDRDYGPGIRVMRALLDTNTCMALLPNKIPAGAVGNARPIDVEAEVWTTDAFGLPLTVLTVTRDPLGGTHRQELRNIREVDFDDDAFRPDENGAERGARRPGGAVAIPWGVRHRGGERALCPLR